MASEPASISSRSCYLHWETSTTQAIDLAANRKTSGRKTLADEALGDVFGIEIGSALPKKPSLPAKVRARISKPAVKQKRAGRTVGKSKR